MSPQVPTVFYRRDESQGWETYTYPVSGRPALFLGYRAAFEYALESSDERLKYQFKIEPPEKSNGNAHRLW